MKKKKIYTAPQTLIYQTEVKTAILAASEIILYQDTETDLKDLQY